MNLNIIYKLRIKKIKMKQLIVKQKKKIKILLSNKLLILKYKKIYKKMI